MSDGPRFPATEPPIDAKTGGFSWRYLRWFTDLRAALDRTPSVVSGGVVQKTAQTATIGTTPIPTAALAAGLYTVEWYGQVTTAAGVSSSFQVTISWTRNAVAQSFTGTLENGNTTATNDADTALLIHIDASTPVSYAVAYASNPAAAMRYELNVVLTRVSQDA